MLRPAILIGCGGSGSKAIRYVRDAVERRIRHAGWSGEMPTGWEFLALDTLNIQEDPTEIPLLPQSDFHSISPSHNNYQRLEPAVLAQHEPSRARTLVVKDDSGRIIASKNEGAYLELVGWRPRPSEVRVPLKTGAGANRAIGRFAGIDSLHHILEPPIKRAFEAAEQSSGDLARISEMLRVPVRPGGEVPSPMVVVCASMAGGTGAGVALDVVEIIRNTHPDGSFPSLVLFTPDIFNEPKFDARRSSMAGNALSLLSETLNVYWDSEQQGFPLWAGSLNQPGRGPQATFLVGRRSMRGGDLGNATSVYKAVGESLANWVTNYSVQEAVHHFVTVNWDDRAADSLGGYPFGKQHQTGAVSSFGAATLSVGRDRFERWATDLLAREVLEALAHGHLRNELQDPGRGNQPESVIIEELAEVGSAHIARGDATTPLRQRASGDTSHRGALSAGDAYANDDAARSERRKVESDLHDEFPANIEGSGADWHSWLQSAAQQRRIESLQRARSFDATTWGTEMLAATCRAVSAVVAQSSLEVARHAVERAAQLLNDEAESLRRRSDDARRQSDDELSEALRRIQEVPSTNRDSATFNEVVAGLATGIARLWLAERLDMAAMAVEAANHRVFFPAGDTLRMATRSVGIALQQPEVQAWPRVNDGVPPPYRPSSVELPLEQHDTWPSLLDDLCAEAQSPRTAASLPVNAARFALVLGDDSTVPLLWPQNGVWSPTESSLAAFTCPSDAQEITERVTSWTRRPSSRFDRFVKEGLASYLAERDPVTGSVRADHADRLVRLRAQLGAAKLQSAPLVRIDPAVHGVVYPGQPPIVGAEELLCAPFPFPESHPAHDIARQIIGEDNYQLADSDVSSVLVSSFLSKPVHPMTLASFTEPVAEAVLDTVDDEAELQASFWRWRRARRLDQFVPLPRVLRQALMRGFAVARLCGYVTSDTSMPLLISGDGGPVEFPYPLLTQVESDDVLAGLLESFGLAFAFVSRDKLAAFESYRRLHDLGESVGSLHADLASWLQTGTTPHERVDEPRAVGDSAEERRSAADRYLSLNLEHLESVAAQALSGSESETKPRDGRAESGIPTREVVAEAIGCYQQVKDSLRHVDESPVV
ncbi:tubulin-like doman-containing protein [Candidatus Poriferisodalis sp.]|uniref:tubulin-like doman-containing protein n=1 Tax=Candidatus Poriferisodalis sp. TaxID=3101277 RepID=UPI003B02A1A4